MIRTNIYDSVTVLIKEPAPADGPQKREQFKDKKEADGPIQEVEKKIVTIGGFDIDEKVL